MNIRHWLIIAIPLPLLAGCSAPDPTHARVVRSLLEARRDHVVVQRYDLSCGAAALATVLTYEQGDKVSEREVAAGMLRHTSIRLVQQQLGFSLLDLKHYAESRGFAADGYTDLTLDDLVNFGPTIVPVKLRGFSHFVIFRGMQGNRVLLADPAFGNRTMPAETFENIWENRIGFTVNRTDGRPAPNMLAANSSDFWASSGQLHVAAPAALVAPAAPPAAAPADQPAVIAVSRPEPQPAAAGQPASPPATTPANQASMVALAAPGLRSVAAGARSLPPALAPANQASVIGLASPELQSVTAGARSLPPAVMPANQPAAVAGSHTGRQPDPDQ